MLKSTKKRSPKKTVRPARTRIVRSRRAASSEEAGLPPALPKPNAAGLVDALTYLRASIARDLVRARRKAGLTQQQLAALAHVRQETISRIESAKHTATARVLDRLMRALAGKRKTPSRN